MLSRSLPHFSLKALAVGACSVLAFVVLLMAFSNLQNNWIFKRNEATALEKLTYDDILHEESSDETVVENVEDPSDQSTPTPSPVRLLCWVMTDPQIIKQAVAVRDTWMRRCDVMLFMSSKEDKEFPTLGMNVSAGRNFIAAKSKAAWTYINKHYIDQADYFMKSDPDTYVMVDNLRDYLSRCDPTEPNIYGHALKFPHRKRVAWSTNYVAGQAVVLSREAVRRLVDVAIPSYPGCFNQTGQAEDLKTSLCLYKVGGHVIDTHDNFGRETFLPPIHIDSVVTGNIHLRTPWYATYRLPYGYCQGTNDCFSDHPVSFHWQSITNIYLLDYLERLIKVSRNRGNSHHRLSFNGTKYYNDEQPSK